MRKRYEIWQNGKQEKKTDYYNGYQVGKQHGIRDSNVRDYEDMMEYWNGKHWRLCSIIEK